MQLTVKGMKNVIKQSAVRELSGGTSKVKGSAERDLRRGRKKNNQGGNERKK